MEKDIMNLLQDFLETENLTEEIVKAVFVTKEGKRYEFRKGVLEEKEDVEDDIANDFLDMISVVKNKDKIKETLNGAMDGNEKIAVLYAFLYAITQYSNDKNTKKYLKNILESIINK